MSLGARFGPREAAYLRANYREGPIVTDWPCGTHHHFASQLAYLWIINSQWMAGSEYVSFLLRMTRELWWLAGGVESSIDEINAGVREIRQQPPSYPGPGWDKVFGDDLGARFANGCWLESPCDQAVPPPRLDELLDHFDEKSRLTFAGGLTALFLERGKQRIFLVTETYGEKRAESSWWLHGDDEGELEQLAHFVCRWGELNRTLAANTEPGKAVLARLRKP
jgi:hypothetical protein